MNVPKIRINGFDGEWKLVPFSKVATLRRGLTYSPSNISENGVRVLRSCNIDEDTFVTSDDDVFVKTNCVNIPLVNDGDILITAANGSPRLVGKHCIVKNPKAELMAHGGFMLLASSNDSNFLNASMGSSWFEDFKRIGIAGGNGAIGNLNKNELENFLFYVPTSKAERDKIATYFDNLDSLIETTGKKIASLKQTKLACLQQMFPADGETTPRIRFRGFEGVWQLRKIGELGTTYSGLSGKSKADFGLGSAQYITFLNVLTNAHIDTTIFESVNIKPGEKQNKVVKGDILFNTSSETPEEVGYCSVLMNDIDNLYLNSFCFGFRPYAGTINPEFMVYLMRGQIGRSIMKILAQGATRYNLSKNRLCEVTIPIPANDEEQQQIAAFFSNMDKQIRIQEQRLEKLKRIKTACLENMFV